VGPCPGGKRSENFGTMPESDSPLEAAWGYLSLGMIEDAWGELEELPPEHGGTDATMTLRIAIFQHLETHGIRYYLDALLHFRQNVKSVARLRFCVQSEANQQRYPPLAPLARSPSSMFLRAWWKSTHSAKEIPRPERVE
jgi:hypothetical protein